MKRRVSVIEGRQGERRSTGIQFETLEHEGEDLFPGFEDEIAQQGFQVLKKGLASAQSPTNGVVLLIHQA